MSPLISGETLSVKCLHSITHSYDHYRYSQSSTIIKSYIIQINYNILRLLSNNVTQFSRVSVVKIRVCWCWSSFNLYCMWAVGWVRSIWLNLNRLFEYDLWCIEKKVAANVSKSLSMKQIWKERINACRRAWKIRENKK
jgi:hypothetical protein